MGDRYLISGSQIGMLKAFGMMNNQEQLNKILDEIENNQFVFTSSITLKDDVESYSEGR